MSGAPYQDIYRICGDGLLICLVYMERKQVWSAHLSFGLMTELETVCFLTPNLTE